MIINIEGRTLIEHQRHSEGTRPTVIIVTVVTQPDAVSGQSPASSPSRLIGRIPRTRTRETTESVAGSAVLRNKSTVCGSDFGLIGPTIPASTLRHEPARDPETPIVTDSRGMHETESVRSAADNGGFRWAS